MSCLCLLLSPLQAPRKMPVGKVLGVEEENNLCSQEINQYPIREEAQGRDSSLSKVISQREQSYFGLSNVWDIGE